MKIKSAVLESSEAERPYAQTKPLSIEEVDLEGPGMGEVLVQVAAAGLCHSDLSIIDGNRPRPLPMVARSRNSNQLNYKRIRYAFNVRP